MYPVFLADILIIMSKLGGTWIIFWNEMKCLKRSESSITHVNFTLNTKKCFLTSISGHSLPLPVKPDQFLDFLWCLKHTQLHTVSFMQFSGSNADALVHRIFFWDDERTAYSRNSVLDSFLGKHWVVWDPWSGKCFVGAAWLYIQSMHLYSHWNAVSVVWEFTSRLPLLTLFNVSFNMKKLCTWALIHHNWHWQGD